MKIINSAIQSNYCFTNCKRLLLPLALFLMAAPISFAQTTITGTIKDGGTGGNLAGVNIIVKGRVIGTISDGDGNFNLKVNTPPPFALTFSFIGFKTQEVQITDANTTNLEVILEEQDLLGQEIVVSASRAEESIMEAPVAIEKMNIHDIQQTPAQDFYSSLINFKNVDMSTQSLTFKSVSLRGFNANGNTRVVQMNDGMDNQAPGLNFAVGNIVGISELDLESVELLPGASSALYGPNAINGIILLNSKSPFEYPGLSLSLKTGYNHVDGKDRDASLFTETSLRYARSFNNRFAFKINASYLDGKDWYASDLRDRSLDEAINRNNSPSYEAINLYGDETSAFLPLGQNGEDVNVTRTGFKEADLVDYNVSSAKFSGALHYKITDDLEAIFQGNYGTGQTVYTGIDRYSLQNFTLQQYKAELRSSALSLRAYTTLENSGDSYAIGTLGLAMNEVLKPSSTWFQEYGEAFAGAAPGVEALNHQAARQYADRDIPLPGSPEFESAKESLVNTPLSQSGAKFLDKTGLYAFEGSYNFKNSVHFVELIAGANYRVYELNSEGTLFALDDDGSEFSFSEYGGFLQASKKVLNDKIKLTASIRYDKNENFEGKTTPRISGVYSFLGENHLRVSYQTGFRMPTTQNQYIDLPTPQARLIGGLPFFRDRYNFTSNPVYDQQTYEQYVGTFLTAQGQALAAGQTQQDAYIAASQAAAPVLDGAAIENTNFELEQNKTIEIGYRGLVKGDLLLDAYYYFSTFNNFLAGYNLFQSSTTEGDPAGLLTASVYQTTVSLDQKVESQGAAVELSYKLNRKLNVSTNYAWNEITNQGDIPEGFQTGFNTPKHKVNLSLASRKLTEHLGFALTWRWQDAFYWESSFAVGEVPAYATLDAQVSYRLPKLKSIVKVGGSNITNHRYEQALGNPTVGSMYYVSIMFDQFLRN